MFGRAPLSLEGGTAPDAAFPAAHMPDPPEGRALRAKAARRDVTERRRVTQRLREALATEGFLLHYQPQVHLKSGLIRGAEALIRLRHRRRGLILPAQFMPVAERGEVINDIGAWILHEACAAAAAWPARYAVGVGLSHRQLRSGKLTRHLVEALTKTGLAPERLELALSEAMLIDGNEDTNFTLQAIRGLGIRMALNNFGVGYASLSALKRLPLGTLKLDRSMVKYLGQDHAQTAIVHAAVEAGHALGCVVMADGVETAAQCRILDEIGCDEGQGAFFSPPLTEVDLRAKLNLG